MHHNLNNSQLFYRLDALPIAQPIMSEHTNIQHTTSRNTTTSGDIQTNTNRAHLAHSNLIWGLPSLSWPIKAPGYLGEGCQASHHISPLTPVNVYCKTQVIMKLRRGQESVTVRPLYWTASTALMVVQQLFCDRWFHIEIIQLNLFTNTSLCLVTRPQQQINKTLQTGLANNCITV